MNIAFFDSGLGGLSVLKTAYKLLPNENYIYYADSQNAPYGLKPESEIKKYIFKSINFLSTKNIKILVLACNTASSASIDELRKKFKFSIVGMEPAIKPAIENNRNKKILVLATTFTLKAAKLENLRQKFDKENKVDKLALDKLVFYAENFEFNSRAVKEYLNNKFKAINLNDYETIVLGCAHFIFYKSVIKELIPPDIDIIDGNYGTIKNMIAILEKNKLLNNQNKKENNITFYSTGVRETEARVNKFKELLF